MKSVIFFDLILLMGKQWLINLYFLEADFLPKFWTETEKLTLLSIFFRKVDTTSPVTFIR